MKDISCLMSSIEDKYHGYQDMKTKTVTVLYDDKNIHDEETTFEFRADGSATARSNAWGTKTEVPPGTLSYMMKKMPETEVLNAKLASQLVNEYYANLKKENK